MLGQRSNFSLPLAVLLSASPAILWPSRAEAQQPDSANPVTAPSGSAPRTANPASSDDTRGSLMPAPGTITPAPMPVVDPNADQRKLTAQGNDRPSSDGSIGAKPGDVFSEDWWGHTRPVLELHGYFRTRAELFHNFALGRHNGPDDGQHLWPQPLDQSYTDQSGAVHNVNLCGPPAAAASLQPCYDKSQASANIRFRVNPELHISDNLRIMAQIDALDNLVLGSTPDAYAVQPSLGSTATSMGAKLNNGSGYSPASTGYNGYVPLGAFSTTQGPPTPGVNSYRNSIDVKRVWAEYMTPLGQLRFGRMPSHWGLGMVQNAGDTIDSDYQTTTDRIMFVSGIKSLDLYFGGAWDYVSSGPTSASPSDVYGGQPYATGNLTNVNEYVLFAARRTNPELQKLSLARNDVVINGGIYATYRSQLLDVTSGQTPLTTDVNSLTNKGLERRGAYAFTPDLWIQALWRKFRFEAEFAAIYGSIENSAVSQDPTNAVLVRQYGLTTQAEFKTIEDKLHIGFGFGWASGDPWAASLNPGNSLQPELNGRGPISTFRFHPDYRVDLIFFRHILGRVEGAYYFRPSVDYEFLKNANGQKFGGGAAIIWSRASEFVQTPGNKRDLGVELDLSLYFQAKDGSLNDDPTKLGGFYSMLQYGVFFPLGGLSYLPGQQTSVLPNWDTSTAQTVRLFLGVAY